MSTSDDKVIEFLRLLTLLNKINGVVVGDGNEQLSKNAYYDSDSSALTFDLGIKGYYEYRLMIHPDGTWQLHEFKPE